MAAHHRNPDLGNTAARYVAKAMTRVHPLQREALLEQVIHHAHAGLAQIRDAPAPRSFLDEVREILGPL